MSKYKTEAQIEARLLAIFKNHNFRKPSDFTSEGDEFNTLRNKLDKMRANYRYEVPAFVITGESLAKMTTDAAKSCLSAKDKQATLAALGKAKRKS